MAAFQLASHPHSPFTSNMMSIGSVGEAARSAGSVDSAARQTGPFAFCCAAFTSGQAARTRLTYLPDGLAGPGFFLVRRSGEHLVGSCLDSPQQSQVAKAEARCHSQVRDALRTRNEELQTSNAHCRMANTALLAGHQPLRQLPVAQQDLLE